MTADGHIIFKTAGDNSRLEKDLEVAKSEIKRMEAELKKSSDKEISAIKAKEKAYEQLQKAREKLAEATGRHDALVDAAAPVRAELANIKAALEAARAREDAARTRWRAGAAGADKEQATAHNAVVQLQADYDKLGASLQKMEGPIDKAAQKAREQAAAVQTASAAYEQAATAAQELATQNELMRNAIASAKINAAGLEQKLAKAQSAKPLNEALVTAEKKVGKFTARIGTMLRKVFMFGVILSALRSVKSWFAKIIKQNDEAAAAIARLKGALLTLAQPIVDVAIPAFTKLCNILTKIVAIAANAAALLFGRSVQDTAKAAEALNAEREAISGAGDAAEEAAGKLAGFDEVNQLGGDNGGNGGANGEIKPDFSEFGAGEFRSTLDKLTAILGGALLVIGAILTFSGANIPLGIGMMALGAAILYKEAQLNWGDPGVRDAINAILLTVGIGLLVIGAVLAFSGVDVPRGIAMMALGTAALYSAAALNWDSLSTTVQEAISGVLVLVGVVALVIGTILAFSSINIPLGIGLIALGAASVAAAAALNWDLLGSTIHEKLGNILSIIGGFLAVMGVVLMLTGVAFGIGLAMLIAGVALIFSGSVTAQWDSVPDTVSAKLGLILKVLGGSLLVLGVILLLSGVAAPIGLGLILAGVGALGVSAAAANWDFITDKVESIWKSVKAYYNSNIKQYFTITYWKSKAADIIAGLATGIRNGLSTLKDAISGTVSKAWDSVKGSFSSGSGGSRGAAAVPVQATSARITTADVPALARGAVIPPNREFMAVLGDQRNGNNIEAPEDLIRKIVREESGSGNTELLQAILEAIKAGHIIMVDSTVLGRTAIKSINDANTRAGKQLLNI